MFKKCCQTNQEEFSVNKTTEIQALLGRLHQLLLWSRSLNEKILLVWFSAGPFAAAVSLFSRTVLKIDPLNFRCYKVHLKFSFLMPRCLLLCLLLFNALQGFVWKLSTQQDKWFSSGNWWECFRHCVEMYLQSIVLKIIPVTCSFL